jgi:hypothetical protein
MKNTNFIFLLGVCFFTSNWGGAQSDTILVGYSTGDTVFSLINEMLILPNDKIGFTKRIPAAYKAYVTDAKGQVLHERLLDSADEYIISAVSFMFEDSIRYVYIGNATRDGERYFVSFSLDTTLQHLTIIDTVNLNDDIRLFFDIVKFNSYKNIWEGFGISQKITPSQIISNCYVSLTPNFQFSSYQSFEGEYPPFPILEFEWVESMSRYFLSSFGGYALLVDEDMNVLYEDAILISYPYNNSMATSALDMYRCFDIGGGKIFCYGKEFWNRPYNASFVTLDLQGDSIHIAEAIPLSDPPLGMNFASQMRVDLDGNYVISGVDGFSPPTPNKVRVVKYTPTYEKIWDFTYESDVAFAIWDMEIDQHNDIILVGQAWNLFGGGEARGFLMKVYSTGTLTSYYEVPDDPSEGHRVRLSPTPATSQLCLQAPSEIANVQLWDLDGRLVWERSIAVDSFDLPYCLDLPEGLPPGFYAAEVLFADGHRTTKKVVVGRR